MRNLGTPGLPAAALLFVALAPAAAVAAQSPAPPAEPAEPATPATPADDAAKAAQAAGAAAFQAGAEAYRARDYPTALAHYAAALKHFAKGWPEAADADTARRVQLQVWRARAFAHGRQGDIDGFLADAAEALRLIGALGGDGPEEQSIQSALFECLNAGANTQLGKKLVLLNRYRQLVLASLPSNQTAGQGYTHRLRKQVGQVLHEIAFAQDRAGKLEDSGKSLASAIAYRLEIRDLTGAGWSSQNLFWNLLRRRELTPAAKQFGSTVQMLRNAPNVDIEGSLVTNLESWCKTEVAAKRRDTALALLRAIRTTGALNDGGLPTFSLGRLCALELAMTAPGTPETRDARFNLAELLVKAGRQESQPAWTWLGESTRLRAALEVEWPGDAEGRDSLRRHAEAAAAAARELADPHRIGLASLLLADVHTASGELEQAEALVQRVFTTHSAPGAEPWLREVARRTGAALATKADRADWAQRYTLHAVPKHPGAAGGHTMMGRTPAEFFRAVAALPGEGAILTLTRRGKHLIVRSPLFTGTVAVEWGWRLRYVNANGILLAVQGPAVAVIGKHTDVTAPKANNGVAREDGEGGLDLALLAGEQLPALASQEVVPPGETLFVNKYLRVFR